MANWSKRKSRKSGTYSRTTTTTNSKGGSTRSTSVRVGSGPRRTESVKNQNGKTVIKRYTTEYHPTLGTKRTTQTVYASSNAKPKKPKKPKKARVKKSTRVKTSYTSLPAAKQRDWVKHPRGTLPQDNYDSFSWPQIIGAVLLAWFILSLIF